jgi:hypothetical protein
MRKKGIIAKGKKVIFVAMPNPMIKPNNTGYLLYSLLFLELI